MIKGAKGAKRGGGWVDEVFRTCFVVEGGMVGGLGSMGCVVEFGDRSDIVQQLDIFIYMNSLFGCRDLT